MRRFFTFCVCCMFAVTVTARQKITRNFHNVSLAQALTVIAKEATTYDINFLHTNLEQITVNRSISNMDVPEAVRTLCKGMPVKVKCRGKSIIVTYHDAGEQFTLYGKVVDNKTRNDVPGAIVELLSADGKLIDRKIARSTRINDNDTTYHSDFSFLVPRREATYVLHTMMLGYHPSSTTITLSQLRKREHSRQLPPLLIRDSTIILKEVQISSSKVMFYYKGDTVVYNADAFVLAEGSMLDALVKQLPGVELKPNGDIYHNGQFVKTLLLNGKDLFSRDRKVLLENLPTYMVKEIQVYKKRGKESEFLKTNLPNDMIYVMDVKLKKEYCIGYMSNIEGGAGVTSSQHNAPYLGRLFALRFTDHSRVSFFANVNNLNDDRQPGADNGWQPDYMSTGTLTQQKAGVDYNIDARNKKWEMSGFATLSHSIQNGMEKTDRTNFLSSGDTYERIENSKRNKNLMMAVNNQFETKGSRFRLLLTNYFDYKKYSIRDGMESMAFQDTVINRYLSAGLNRGHKMHGELVATSTLKLSDVASDYILFSTGAIIDRLSDETFKRYSMFNGSGETPSKASDQYFDNTPDRGHELFADCKYHYELNKFMGFGLAYKASLIWKKRNSRLYLLDQMQDYEEGELGWLPSAAEYESVQDFGNSYQSTLYEARNTLTPNFGLYKPTENGYWSAQINMPLRFMHSKLTYMRGATDTIIRRNTMLPELNSTYVSWTSNDRSRNIDLRYWLNSYSPDLQYMVDIKDDTDPLNIRQGNSGLSNSYRHRLMLSGWIERNKKYRYYLELSGSITDNAIAMGYLYDVGTGVRTYKAYNVDGNWDISLRHTFRMQQKNLSLEADLKGTHQQNADITGSSQTDGVGKSTVRNERLDFSTNIGYTFGQNSVKAIFETNWRYLHSSRETFSNMHVANYRYGIKGIVTLPLRFQFSTDITVYSRRGYHETPLNTNDLVWNARLSYPMMKGRLVLMLDGFDILGNLSNVTYSVNGQGRTEVRRNVLPQYALFHIQYKFNQKPKSKRKKGNANSME